MIFSPKGYPHQTYFHRVWCTCDFFFSKHTGEHTYTHGYTTRMFSNLVFLLFIYYLFYFYYYIIFNYYIVTLKSKRVTFIYSELQL